jgi:hypothetical protein
MKLFVAKGEVLNSEHLEQLAEVPLDPEDGYDSDAARKVNKC